jgi:hypothetical protein
MKATSNSRSLTGKERRALNLLASKSCKNGCTQQALTAKGFTEELLAQLSSAGLAVDAGDRFLINKAGLKAIKKYEHELAEYGEDLARRLLSDRGFDAVKMPERFPYFDLMAKQGAHRLLVPVKTRNKHEADGNLKRNTYNLYTKPHHLPAAQKIATFFGAELRWIAVTVDTCAKTFSACMGDVSALPNNAKQIPMDPDLHVPTYERLARDEPDRNISAAWSNQRKADCGKSAFKPES